ncbi:hypothetical protein BDB01DRAFT_839690 [Pilobolus umbonatus]|nr:hypothetical protein BDB01DRAFT_839690 [Pilobolus umbonatus]
MDIDSLVGHLFTLQITTGYTETMAMNKGILQNVVEELMQGYAEYALRLQINGFMDKIIWDDQVDTLSVMQEDRGQRGWVAVHYVSMEIVVWLSLIFMFDTI